MLGSCVLETRALNPKALIIEEKTDELPPDYYEIELIGNLMFSVGPNAIVVGVNDNSFYIQFSQNLGYVDITIINPNGLTVYTGFVNTAVQQQVVIPINFTLEGTYTIVLENTTDYAEGAFQKLP